MKDSLRMMADELGDALHNIENNYRELDVISILNWIYGVAGIVAVGFVVYGAVNYTLAQGEPGKIKQASQTLVYAFIGLGVVLLAATLTNFVFKAVIG